MTGTRRQDRGREGMLCNWCHVVLIGFLSLNLSAVTAGELKGTDEQEVAALLSLKASFGNPDALVTWEGDDPCTQGWTGVYCQKREEAAVASDGRQLWFYVKGISLKEVQLGGSLSPEISKLPNLQWLELDGTGIGGGIPEAVGSLSQLAYISLAGNRLEGVIPGSLGSIQNLRTLNLASNNLRGSVPRDFQNTQNMQYFDASNNSLSGEIPVSLQLWEEILELSLHSNELSGAIPAWLGSLKSLKQLELSRNQLTGVIPPELGSLEDLEGLSLNDNQLAGEIPETLTGLPKLVDLRLHNNRLQGPVPSGLLGLSGASFYGNPGLCSATDSGACGPFAAPPPPPQLAPASAPASGPGLVPAGSATTAPPPGANSTAAASCTEGAVQICFCVESESKGSRSCAAGAWAPCLCNKQFSLRKRHEKRADSTFLIAILLLVLAPSVLIMTLCGLYVFREKLLRRPAGAWPRPHGRHSRHFSEAELAENLDVEKLQQQQQQQQQGGGGGRYSLPMLKPLAAKAMQLLHPNRGGGGEEAHPRQGGGHEGGGGERLTDPLRPPGLPSSSSASSTPSRSFGQRTYVVGRRDELARIEEGRGAPGQLQEGGGGGGGGGGEFDGVGALPPPAEHKRAAHRRNFSNEVEAHFQEAPSPSGATRWPAPSDEQGVWRLTFAEVRVCTNDFDVDNIVGKDGIHRVYCGELQDGRRVAVKELEYAASGTFGASSFTHAVEIYGRLMHPNLVKIVGFCCEDDSRLLISEFVPNLSLDHHLYEGGSESVLDWNTRMFVALGAARGLKFLHEYSPPVVHENVRATNVLLDESFNSRLSDYALSLLTIRPFRSLESQSSLTNNLAVAAGSAAPELAWSSNYTPATDVYAFGVLLLEIVAGRKPLDAKRPPNEQALVRWARPKLTERSQVESLVDWRLGRTYSRPALYQVALLAWQCIHTDPDLRPSIGQAEEVLQRLQNLPLDAYGPTAGGEFLSMAPALDIELEHHRRPLRRVPSGSSVESGGRTPIRQSSLKSSEMRGLLSQSSMPSRSSQYGSAMPGGSRSPHRSSSYELGDIFRS